MEKLYAGILAVIFGGIVLHAPLSVWLGTIWPEYALVFKVWKEILLGVELVLAVVITSQRGLWRRVMEDTIVRLIAVFALLHILLTLFFFQGAAATAAGLAIDLRYLLYFGLVYLLMLFWPQYRAVLVKIGIVGAAVVVGFATLQLFLPADILASIGYGPATIQPYLTVDDNSDFVRVNSTLRGPNPLGVYAVIVLACLAAFWLKSRHKTGKTTVFFVSMLLCSLVALWLSYSRSAWVAAIVALGIVAVVILKRSIRWQYVVGVATGILVVGFIAVVSGSAFVSTVLLHDDPSGGADVTSDEQHASSLMLGVQRLLGHPFGEGVGSAGSASLHTDVPTVVESHYFFVAHESGALGLALFMSIFILVMRRLWLRRDDPLALGVFASGIGLGLAAFLLPVWADDTVSIIWWGLAAIVIGGYYGNTTKQKTKRTA